MSPPLSDLQFLFTRLVGELIGHAYQQGYTLTLGEAWRTPEQARWNAQEHKGISHSVHMDRLAVDFNLFRDGKYLGETSDHQPLGEWWEEQNTLCRWGGRFGDGNHYSLEYNGVK